MIVSHRAPSRLNMSSYQAIWTHFKPNSGFQIPLLQIAPEGTPKKYGGRIFLRKKAPAATCPQVRGFQKYGAHFSGKTKRLRQRPHKPRASRNMWPIFYEKKKALAATYPQVRGFQTNWCNFSEKKKKRLRHRTHKLGASRNT